MSHGIAASSICSPGSVKHPVLSTVKDIDIDKNGKFKYILIKVHDPCASTREFKHIVRGYQRANYHGKYTKFYVFYICIRVWSVTTICYWFTNILKL